MTGDAMKWPVMFLGAVIVGMICFFALKIRNEMPVCVEYRMEWREANSYRNMGSKQKEMVHVPAQWAEICTRWGKPD